jgi:hypothetical protein
MKFEAGTLRIENRGAASINMSVHATSETLHVIHIITLPIDTIKSEIRISNVKSCVLIL